MIFKRVRSKYSINPPQLTCENLKYITAWRVNHIILNYLCAINIKPINISCFLFNIIFIIAYIVKYMNGLNFNFNFNFISSMIIGSAFK